MTQPSEESPPEVELALTNTGDAPLTVSPDDQGMYPLEFLAPLRGETGDVLLFPQIDADRVHLYQGEFPERPVDGCWRVLDTSEGGETGPYLAGVNYPKERELGPGETYSVTHEAYYRGPGSGCFPSDTYRTTADVVIGSDDRTHVHLTYRLDVSPELEFSIAVESGGDR